MPRTTGIKLVGSCGHETKERILVNVWGDYNTENLEKLEKYNSKRKEEALGRLCLDCEANNRSDENRIELKKLTDLLEIEDFPEFIGTVRMNAYASVIRRDMISREVANIMSNVMNRLTTSSIIDQILFSTLSKAWGNESLPPLPQDLFDLHTEMNTLALEATNGLEKISDENKEISLAAWLLLKFRLSNQYTICYEDRAKVWITIGRSRYGSPLLEIKELPSQIYLSAIIVSQFNYWNNRTDAWNTFQILNRSASHDVTNFLEKRAETESSLKNLITQLGVILALSKNSSPAGGGWA